MNMIALADRLNYLRGRSPQWRERYDELVARLRALRIGATAPRTGDRFPDIGLPDHRGRYRTLAGLLQEGPLVLSFTLIVMIGKIVGVTVGAPMLKSRERESLRPATKR